MGTAGDSERFPVTTRELPAEASTEGLVLRDSENGETHYLNQVAAMVYLLSTGENSIAAIAGQVSTHFGLAEPPLADVTTALKELETAGLIRLSAG